MNCTDLIGVGLVVIGGGVWLDAAGLPGGELPVYGFRLWVLGLGLFLVGCWRAGRLVDARRNTGNS